MVYVKVVPLTVGLVRVSGVPSLNSCASTVSNETSDATIAELSIKVQVKVIPVPTITMSELLLLVSISEEGGGTTYNIMNMQLWLVSTFQLILTLNPDVISIDTHCYNVS